VISILVTRSGNAGGPAARPINQATKGEPMISNKKFPETRKYEERGIHQILYRFSPDDYREISKIWKGTHPEDGSALRVVDGPPEGGGPSAI
jgi:Mn-containing catalase